MRTIFIYEYLSGGGEIEHEADAAELLPMGLSMRDAMVSDLQRLPDLAVTCATSYRAALPASATGLKGAAPQTGESAVAFVQRQARLHDLAWIVAPESGGQLGALREAVGAARWIGCSAAAICIASSKSATLKALAAHGVATPLDFAKMDGSRWVVKPDDGAGAIDTRVHADQAAAQADLQQRRRAGASATLEPYVEGEALSISLLAGPGFVQPVAFNRQSVSVNADGHLRYLGVQPNAIDMRSDPRASRLHTLALDVKRALPGLRGFVGVDVVWHAERGPVVIEVNPRVTCAYAGLSAALGRNLAAEILLLHGLPEASDATA